MIKPVTPLARFQKLLSIPRFTIIWKFLCIKHKELIKQLPAFAGLGTMLLESPLKVVRYAYVSLTVSCLQDI
jgi:hypothetical protein